MRYALLSTFWQKINRTNGCWEWTGFVTQYGYGETKVKIGKKWMTKLAHRAVYEVLVGPIPVGLTLDHLCRNTTCVNPKHLEAVSIRENALRGTGPTAINAKKTHCKNGHSFNEKNTYLRIQGKGHHVGRMCKQCGLDRQRMRKASLSNGR